MKIQEARVPPQAAGRTDHPHRHALAEVVAEFGRHVNTLDPGIEEFVFGCHEFSPDIRYVSASTKNVNSIIRISGRASW